jgi:phosphoglycolate phosphatase-like HAD superfamily hydrolase
VDDGPAVEAINSFLQSNLPATGQVRSVLVGVQEELGYPSGPPSSLLSTLFDETYHGSQLYKRMYGANAQYYRGAGLIENERRLVRKADLDRLTERLGKQRLAIVTGRPYLALEHTLRTMLSYFNLEASAFIGDADVPPQLRRTLSPFRKPSGQLLIHAQRIFSSQMLLSVGDSAEDVKMAENAKLSGTPALSAGVYGTNSDPKGLAQFFREREVDLILPTARQISTALRFAEK